MPTLCDNRIPELLVHEASGTTVHVAETPQIARLLQSDHRVGNAYRALRCRIGFASVLSIGRPRFDADHEVDEASPLWAVAAHESKERAMVVYAKSQSSRLDAGGFNWLGMTLGLDPDYCRGHQAGWFGQTPDLDSSLYRQGWRDGAACYRDLCGLRSTVI